MPEPRAAGRQKFCRRPACRQISRRTSQQRWLKNQKGRAYHAGPIAVARMQEWRKSHPQYWRRGAAAAEAPDLPSVIVEFFRGDSCVALQDSWPPQVVALVGLIAWLRGGALQDTIAADLREIMVAGNALLPGHLAPSSPRNSAAGAKDH